MVDIKYIDRRKCRRVVPMQVLCLGASRTGTECKHFPSIAISLAATTALSFDHP